jgi:predicted amidohydrolase
MNTFTIAAVQMDCRLMDKPGNLDAIRARLREAAGRGARLAVFPECITTGYCFRSKEEARPSGDPIPGPTTDALVSMCRECDVFAVVGLLETDGAELYNATVLVGPDGLVGTYRKVHLPFLGVDRFTTPGTRPFAVHDIGGLRVGMAICYDSSFPEAARCLMLEGADVIALSTNWPQGAMKTAELVPPTRALENHVYFAAVNRVGIERGVKFIGRSSIANPWGEFLARTEGDEPAILYATVDPAVARQKHIIREPGEYEVDRLRDRRPALYGPLVDTTAHDQAR